MAKQFIKCLPQKCFTFFTGKKLDEDNAEKEKKKYKCFWVYNNSGYRNEMCQKI